MTTQETQKLNETQISTYVKNASCHHSLRGYIVRVSIPGTSFIAEHGYPNAEEAGEAIPGLKEFYRHFDMRKPYPSQKYL